MLVRAGGIGISDPDCFPGRCCPDTVGDNPVFGKIPAANDISGPCCGYGNPTVQKETVFIAVCHKLRA